MKEKLLEVAKELLYESRASEFETVEIRHTEYSDGTTGVIIDLIYKEKNESLINRKDGMLNIQLTNKETKA